MYDLYRFLLSSSLLMSVSVLVTLISESKISESDVGLQKFEGSVLHEQVHGDKSSIVFVVDQPEFVFDEKIKITQSKPLINLK